MKSLLLCLSSLVLLTHAGGPFGVPNCTQKYITQYIDHFDWALPQGSTTGTYQMRYMTYDGFLVNKTVDTVYFYCGNEDAVDLYVNNTGLMWELGQKYNALLVFAEHRYYGKSNPFPPNTPGCMNYLTTEQAMADYAYLIYQLRQNITNGFHIPFIGFGGSYGGMLGSWFRMRYPDALDGVIAASAPIISFVGLDPPYDYNAYYEIVTRDASTAGGATDFCSQNIAYAWPRINNLSQTSSGRSLLEKAFMTCAPLTTQSDAYNLIYWAQDPWGYMAMGDYPYPSDYMTHGDGKPMVAFPARAACKALNTDVRSDDTTLMTGIREMAAVFYNRTGINAQCFYNGPAAKLSPPPSIQFRNRFGIPKNFPESFLAMHDIEAAAPAQCVGSWDYQWCTEMVQPFTSGVGKDMFYPADVFNLQSSSDNCQRNWGVRPRAEWASIGLPGTRLNSGFSNIVFSNGFLDPWSGGGVVTNISLANSVVAIVLPNGAHHLDLMWSNPLDTPDVLFARQFEETYINQWVKEKRAAAELAKQS